MRSVNMAEQRVMEAKKLGFTTCILPESLKETLSGIRGIRLIGVQNVRDAISLIV